MSIYGTILDIADDDHETSCARMRQTSTGIWQENPRKPCTCLCGPLAYQGSHILPSESDPRAGSFDLGAIPGFIGDEDRVLCDLEDCDKPKTECCDRYWPWLRVAVGEAVVVLTRAQAVRVHAAIGDWLGRTEDAQ